LYGASGCIVFLSFTSSTMPKRPIERTAPTHACFFSRSASSPFMTFPMRAAFSIIPSSS
jgi:hypothetical protein